MSLITRCPACGTMFKVVTDQLKVAQGWVRCGHCVEVFDASTHLLPDDAAGLAPSALAPEDGPAAQPGPWARNAAVPDVRADPAEPAEPATAAVEPVLDGVDDFDPAAGWQQAQHERQMNEAGVMEDNAPIADAAIEDAPPSRPELVHTVSADEPDAKPSDLNDSEVLDDKATDAEAVHEVTFVRDARRKAFWQEPPARWSLGALALFLLLALTLQWVIQKKDTLAAREPRLAPLLQALCVTLHCEIRPPRQIDALVIDSSTFTRIGPEAYRLSFALKNTGATPLEIPALEVTLTDTQDQAIVRRVLAPAQFGASSATLAARSELVGVVGIKVTNDGGLAASPATPPVSLRVAGYRILAFYP